MSSKTIVGAIATALLASAAFFNGRHLRDFRNDVANRGHEARTIQPTSDRAEADQSRQSSGKSRPIAERNRPSLPASAREELLGRPIPPRWRALVASDPKAAQSLHQRVLLDMEKRRRANPTRAADCFARNEIGEFMLTFWVQVDSNPAELRIGDATFNHISEGMPLGSQTVDCLTELLRGEKTIEQAQDVDPFPSYGGAIEYRLPFRRQPTSTGSED